MFGLVDTLLDATIVLSFDRTGFLRHAARWDGSAGERSLAGRVCLVTGANSGIGRAAAFGLGRRGARVWLLCRDAARGREARDALRVETGRADIHDAVLDVSDLDAVARFVQAFPEPHVDVLVHNAGVLPAARTETVDGNELTFATNVLGPHLLTRLLEERLAAAPDARVVFVSSGGMLPTALSCDDVQWSIRPFDGVAAYAQTKRMQVVLAERYAERWRGSARSAYAMHPGWADTPAVRTSLPRFHAVMGPLLRTPEQGADTIVWLAAAERATLESGGFYFDRVRRATHLLPFTRESDAERRRLWSLCEERTGLA
jgi:NAD(P)-dependent dehydrogenase (short-subunit alcohol dehydrogenase family)